MAALTSSKWRATLKALPDPGLWRVAKRMQGFFWKNDRTRKNRGTSGCPSPLWHLKELLGIVQTGWQAHGKFLALLLPTKGQKDIWVSVFTHYWCNWGLVAHCAGGKRHGFFKINPPIGIHALCAKGREVLLKWIWDEQCYYAFSEGLSKTLQWCPPVKKTSKRSCKVTGSFLFALSCIWCKTGGRVGDVSEISAWFLVVDLAVTSSHTKTTFSL